MKTGTWYVAGFVVAFVYFYVYAINYIRGAEVEPGYAGWNNDVRIFLLLLFMTA
jgi:hypothetical protein